MFTVLLYGNTEGIFAKQIKKSLAKYGIIFCGRNSFLQNSTNPQFLVAEYSSGVKISASHGIIVMTDEVENYQNITIPQGFTGVVNSSDTKALKLLTYNKIPAVSCGMARTDTLLLSSITENSACVCLQRKIQTFAGGIIEPKEYPLKLYKKISEYGLLAAIAVLLLCGTEPN